MDGSDLRGRVLSAEQGDTLRDYGEGEVRRQGTRNRMPTQLLNIRSHSSMWYNDLPSDSKPPFPSAEGEGRRVRRWWRLDGKWYTGTVGRSYFDTLTLTIRTLVCYDDGEKRYEDMSKGRWLEGDGNGEDEQPPSSDGESDDGLPVDASDEEAEEAEVEEVEEAETEVEVEVEEEEDQEEAVKTEPMAVPLLQIRSTSASSRRPPPPAPIAPPVAGLGRAWLPPIGRPQFAPEDGMAPHPEVAISYERWADELSAGSSADRLRRSHAPARLGAQRNTKFFQRWADEMSSQTYEHAPSPATEHRHHRFERRGHGNMSPAAARRPRPSRHHPHRPNHHHRPVHQINGKRLKHERNAERLHVHFGVCGFHCLHTFVLPQREGIKTPTCHKPKAATDGKISGCEAGSHDEPKGLMQWAFANLEQY